MKKTVLLFLFVVAFSMSLTAFAQLTVPGVDNTPRVGAKAPDFELSKGFGAQAGTLGMKDFIGKKKVLLAFYVADFTAG